jgi:hypothetical protein
MRPLILVLLLSCPCLAQVYDFTGGVWLGAERNPRDAFGQFNTDTGSVEWTTNEGDGAAISFRLSDPTAREDFQLWGTLGYSRWSYNDSSGLPGSPRAEWGGRMTVFEQAGAPYSVYALGWDDREDVSFQVTSRWESITPAAVPVPEPSLSILGVCCAWCLYPQRRRPSP